MAQTQRHVPGFTAPERIELDGFVLRRVTMPDLSAWFAAIDESYPQLHQWMKWCTQPPSLKEFRERIAQRQNCWPDSDGEFGYGIFDADDSACGGVAIADRVGPAAVEIGYWCRTGRTGAGIITRSAGQLTDIALSSPLIDRVEIRCDAANIRSSAVPGRLGYRLDRQYTRPRQAPGDSGTALCWVKESA